MNFLSFFLFYATIVTACISATTVVVSQNPKSGQFSTIQAAVNSLSTVSTTDQTISVEAGTYVEQVKIPARKAHLTIIGAVSGNRGTYLSNKVKLVYGASQADGLTNDETATLRVYAEHFVMHNVDVINNYGSGSQAVALSAQADMQSYYHCRFMGFQDTILSQKGRHYFRSSYIEGGTDFIFGQYAKAWFEKCTIGLRSISTGFVTASGAVDGSGAWYVISSSKIGAAVGYTVPNYSVYLGRPWGLYAHVTVQYTSLTSIINPLGWSVWNKGDERTGKVRFQEFKNTGSGSSTANRASFSTRLSSAVTLQQLFGDYSWIESDYAG